MTHLLLREYATLTVGTLAPTTSLDHAALPKAAWDALLSHAQDRVCELVAVGGQPALRLQNYVGVIELPGDICLEILPKTTDKALDAKELQELRGLLLKMLSEIGTLPKVEHQNASLQILNRPLLEILIPFFLDTVRQLIKRGVRSDYVALDETMPFLRGKWRIQDQLKQPPGRDHLFEVTHDEFLPDCAENRLIHAAVIRVSRLTSNADLQRQLRELRFIFQDVPPSVHHDSLFQKWRVNRNMAHYQPVHPWCKLILGNQTPLCYHGKFQGISLLFPMEKVFEKFVAARLSKQLTDGFILREQVGGNCLVAHENKPWFHLKPDLLIESSQKVAVAILDTKWKRLDSRQNNATDKYGISSADMYQLFAYGDKYLGRTGDLFLIYPAWSGFETPLPPFEFSLEMRLHVMPFDLKNGQLDTPAMLLLQAGLQARAPSPTAVQK